MVKYKLIRKENTRIKEYLVDKKAKETTLKILAKFLGNDLEKIFTPSKIIEFCGNKIPISKSGFYARLRRLKSNHLLQHKKTRKGRIFYCLSKYGIKRIAKLR